MLRSVLAGLVAVLLATGGAAARAEEESPIEPGPIRARDQYVLNLGFLGFDPVSPIVSEPGEWKIDAFWTVANSFALTGIVEGELEARRRREPVTISLLERLAPQTFDGTLMYVDGELSKVMLALSRGVAKGIEVELSIPVYQVGGGFLDSAIEGFHDALGLGQTGRRGALRDDFLVFLRTGAGEFRQRELPSSVFGDAVLAGKFRLPVGDETSPWHLAVQTLIKLPTGSDEPFGSSGSVDAGGQLLWMRDLRRWSFHGSVGVLLLGRSRELHLDSQTIFSSLLSAERQVGGRSSVVFHVSYYESPLERLGTTRIGEQVRVATAGYKVALSSRSVLMMGITENFSNFTNSADVNLHFGVRHRVK